MFHHKVSLKDGPSFNEFPTLSRNYILYEETAKVKGEGQTDILRPNKFCEHWKFMRRFIEYTPLNAFREIMIRDCMNT